MEAMSKETKKTNKRRHEQVNSTTTIVVVNQDQQRYQCKTCEKRFSTYQALGGHQGIHKKVKIEDENDGPWLTLSISDSSSKSSELHRCKLCTKGFPTGQALGGHMRRHRDDKGLRGLAIVKVEPLQVKVEEEDHDRFMARRELILGAREWRLSLFD